MMMMVFQLFYSRQYVVCKCTFGGYSALGSGTQGMRMALVRTFSSHAAWLGYRPKPPSEPKERISSSHAFSTPLLSAYSVGTSPLYTTCAVSAAEPRTWGSRSGGRAKGEGGVM